MRLRLTVAAWPDATLHEVEVEAAQGTTARELGQALATHLAANDAMVLAVQGQELAADAPLGVAPLLDGTSLTLGPPSGAPTSPAAPLGRPVRTVLVLSVTHGPDSGRSHDLTPGAHRIGRSVEADVIVDDDLLSRQHLEITADADGVTVRDLHSTNGARLEADPLGAKPVRWTCGATVRIGHTELELLPSVGIPAACAPQPDGTRLVNRQPRLLLSEEPAAVTLPAAPQRPTRPPLPWVAILAPLPVAALLAVLLGPATLAFALMSPVLLGANVVSERLHGARRYAAQQTQFEGRLAQSWALVDDLCARERRERLDATPNPAETLAIATGPTARLWERRRPDTDALAVGVGVCTSRAQVQVLGPPDQAPVDPPELNGIPCLVRLREVGVLSICGPRRALMGTARSLVGQLLVLHAPVDLQLVVLSAAGRAQDWLWLSRIPHLRAAGSTAVAADLAYDPALAHAVVDRLLRTVKHRAAKGVGTTIDGHPHIVVLLDGAAALRTIPGLSTVLQRGPAAGVIVLALDDVATALPSETGALLDLTDPQHATLRLPGHDHRDFVVDRVGEWWADRLSRALAPLRDATPAVEDSLPSSVPLLSLVPAADEAHLVAALWQRPLSGGVPIGVTAQGPWHLDLAADGPHVLMAGTTGSGKSELLRTIVASMAVHQRPEEMSFVLVDYKGGAAFRGCEQLPHTSAVLTDLDEHLSHRALTSLRAELKRRERLFAAVGASDFLSYRAGSPDEPPLPRLVIVIDEFRALVEEVPQFIDGIVSIAAMGRSLGLHLILATQRPAGVVTADIKANVNLRIALRVREATDSQEVLEAPDAAALDQATPGRGYARAGGSELIGFHAAHLSALEQPTGIQVRDLAWGGRQAPWPSAHADESLDRIVSAVNDAAAMVGAAPGRPLWLPPLPARVPLASLPAPSRPEACAIGLVDRPELHDQVPLELDLASPGHWSFVGAGSSGRTTALLTVARALASRLPADDLHLYAVSGGSLASLAELPHCGAHVDPRDLGRLERLVDLLESELHARRREADSQRAWLLLVVDDWDVLAAHPPSLDHARLVDRVHGLLREGEAHGLMAVVAGDRSLLLGRMASAMSRRVLLRPADRADAVLAGVAASALPAEPPPGRGLLRDGSEVQLALGPAGAPVRTIVAAGRGPVRLDPLPTRVLDRDLPGSCPEGGVLLGLGGDTMDPLALHETQDGRRWLVAGAPRAGVSTTLLLIARRLLSAGRPVMVVSPRPGPLDVLRQERRLITWRDGHTLSPGDLPRDRSALAVVVDCADELLDTSADELLRAHARRVERGQGLLVVGASSTTLSTQYRGTAVEVARDRTGVLLGPRSALEGDLFGLRLRADPQAPPGRGYLLRRGQAMPLQIALSTGPSTEPSD